MSIGWKMVQRDGPHYFHDRVSLCGFFTLRKAVVPEAEPNREDACIKCWQLSHPMVVASSEEETKIIAGVFGAAASETMSS
jgi:hypothetical protein